MEELGPPPDEYSYTAALKGLAEPSAAAGLSAGGLDRVAAALQLRERMTERGVDESAATLTILLRIFGDSALTEEMLTELNAAGLHS
eukprot:gene11725-5480_t